MADVLRAAGFSDARGRTTHLYAGALDNVPPPGPAPVEGLTVRREIGNLTTRFAAVLGADVIGHVHVRDDLTRGGTLGRLLRWAEVWEWFVDPPWRRRGVATWLGRHAVEWLRLGGAERVLVSADDELIVEGQALLDAFGWREIGTSRRAWRRQPGLALPASRGSRAAGDLCHLIWSRPHGCAP